MPLVRCKLGPTEQTVKNRVYRFERDRAGRFVADVDDEALPIFLSVEHYEEVAPLDPAPAMPTPAPESMTPEERARRELEVKQKQTEAERAAAEQQAERERRDREAAEARAKAGQQAAAAPALTDIKGIGGKMAEKLAAKGITLVAQIATMSDDFKAALDAELGLKGAIDRDRWVDQARALAAADAPGAGAQG